MNWPFERIALIVSIVAFAVFGASAVLYFNQRAAAPPQNLSKVEIADVIAKNKDDLFNSPGDPVLGNPNGDVTLVEFFDYLCPYCKTVHPVLIKLLKDDGNIRFISKEYPVLGPVSNYAAQAALAAQYQGKYEAFSSALLGARGLNKDKVFAIAQDVGLDTERLRTDMKTFKDSINATLNLNFALAKSLALKGTPAFIANDTLIPGAPGLAGLEKLIAMARENSH